MVTIGQKLSARRGIGPGFDLLRVALATGVVLWHSFSLTRQGLYLDGTRFFWLPGYAILFMFFGLSGFLISGSASRLSLGNFLINRGLRIFPALIVEITLSAFILGPLFTVLSLREYFSSGQTYHYMTNIISLMNFQLPGVFHHNIVTAVNWSLWTVPYEFGCYAIMSFLMIFGLLRYPKLIIAGCVGLIAIGLIANLPMVNLERLPFLIHKFVVGVFASRGAHLFVAFLCGIAIYLVRDRIPYSHVLLWLSVAIVCGIALAGPAAWLTDPVKTLILALPLTYMMAFLGVSPLPILPVFHRGDYSYGIYLYGMPVQQMMVALFPQVENPWLQFGIAAPAIVLGAIFSWHFIEKPILGLRKNFSFVARVRGVADASDTRVGAPPPAAAEAPDPETREENMTKPDASLKTV